jgi:hypothetical protein
MVPQDGARVVPILPMAGFSGARGTHAVQGVSELLPGFMHVGQTLEAFGKDGIHSVALRTFHRVCKQCQCWFVAALGQMYLGSER